jgi:acetyl-CoA carboxylase biotin carboxyl carrier protein
MDVGLLEQIIRLMAANDLNTVDLRDGERRVVLRRGQPAAPAFPTGAYPPAPMYAGQPPAATPASVPSAGDLGASGGEDESKYVAIKAEMVGTFYSAAKPGEKPFVSVGSTVNEETEVCVIEAMKNFFPQKAGCRGSIARILVQNGQPVQFDQTLFLVKPA